MMPMNEMRLRRSPMDNDDAMKTDAGIKKNKFQTASKKCKVICSV